MLICNDDEMVVEMLVKIMWYIDLNLIYDLLEVVGWLLYCLGLVLVGIFNMNLVLVYMLS